MASNPITDENVMKKFFAEHLEIFGGARGISSIKIFRHDPSLVISQTAVLAKYEITAEMTDGSSRSFTLRGSSDPSQNRRKSYFILQALRQAGFDQGPFQVQKPLGYFEEYHFLLYENFPGPSLMQDFDKNAPDCSEKIAKGIEWLAKFHQTELPSLPRIYYDWGNEIKKFQKLKTDLVTKFGDPQKRISQAADTLAETEKKLFRPQEFVLAHGDFQPNNILAANGVTSVIDFNDAFFYDELFDLIYFQVQTLYMLRHRRMSGLETSVDSAVKNYLKLRKIRHSTLVEKKIALFTAKTLLRIKILTNHQLGSEILREIEMYVRKAV
ncbi:MAG: aminoglycoside phosphotransferase family protein [Patescibacteria group bacterium]|nr:aminoglycoside phosphotransferase family protein [Patescibacteria group bacterium]